MVNYFSYGFSSSDLYDLRALTAKGRRPHGLFSRDCEGRDYHDHYYYDFLERHGDAPEPYFRTGPRGGKHRLSLFNPDHPDFDGEPLRILKPVSYHQFQSGSRKPDPSYLMEQWGRKSIDVEFLTGDVHSSYLTESDLAVFGDGLDADSQFKSCRECDGRVIYDPIRDEEACSSCGLVHRQADRRYF